MVTVDSTLDYIMQLDFSSRELVLEILQKRQIEARRDDIAKSARKSLKDYQSGNLKPLTADEAVKELNSI